MCGTCCTRWKSIKLLSSAIRWAASGDGDGAALAGERSAPAGSSISLPVNYQHGNKAIAEAMAGIP